MQTIKLSLSREQNQFVVEILAYCHPARLQMFNHFKFCSVYITLFKRNSIKFQLGFKFKLSSSLALNH